MPCHPVFPVPLAANIGLQITAKWATPSPYLHLQQHPVIAQGVRLDPLEVEEFGDTDVIRL